ncbi:MAG TPA: hypothetical protein VIP57_09345 [Candidatus Dormibacteraeota bacterium]
MSTDDLEVQVQKISEQLDLQAEAITKLVELVSSLDGVDVGVIKPYATRLKRVHGDAPAAPRLEAPPVAAPPTEAAPLSVDQ